MESHIFVVGKYPCVLSAASGIGRGEHFSPWGLVLPGKLASQNGCAYLGRFGDCVDKGCHGPACSWEGLAEVGGCETCPPLCLLVALLLGKA